MKLPNSGGPKTTIAGNGKKEFPPQNKIRVPGMVHESSVMPITDSENSVIDGNFRPRGVSNVYVTGSSIWPTTASWNPTMTMCAFAQVLADDLCAEKQQSH
jgi:hypothetical protein